MDDITNKCLSEGGNTEPERTDMKELAELSDTPVKDEVTEDKDNESPRNENVEERDTEDLGMQLWSNHIIMREIMSHLDWRQQVPCELVCRLWRDAVKSLQLVNLHSYDFLMQLNSKRSEGVRDKISLLVSKLPVQTRPMCAISFCDPPVLTCPCEDFSPAPCDPPVLTYPCEDFSPAPCDPPCASTHSTIEAVGAIMLSKRSSLLALKVLEMIYMPPPTAHIFQHITYGMLRGPWDKIPLLGLYLPGIPNVHYRTVQYRRKDTAQEDFYSVVDDICATDVIKGVLVFMKYRSGLKIDEENLSPLVNYIKNKQRSIPYALGGCVVSKVMNKTPGIDEDVQVAMGVFSVPKEPEEPVSCCQFNMYSLIIDSTLEEKPAIREAIQTFAGNISKLEYSAALQFSCSSRQDGFSFDQKLSQNSCLNVEQEVFRATFPDTSVLGCYNHSDGVIGYNHPDIRPPPTKRTKRSSDAESKLWHSRSTAFVYFTWGK